MATRIRSNDKDQENVMHFDGCAGDHFTTTIAELLEMLRGKNYELITLGRESEIKTGTLRFNGQTVSFTASDEPDAVWARWSAMMDAARKKHEESDEGIKAAADRAQRVIDNQRILDTEMANLRIIAMSSFPYQKNRQGVRQPIGEVAATLFGTLARLIEAGDHTGVNYDKDEITNLLYVCGYEINEYVGRGPEIKDLASWRAYIAGQIISCISPSSSMCLLPPIAAYKIRQHKLDTHMIELLD